MPHPTQLNMYSFHKVRGDKLDCEFEHERFKKGHRELLTHIKRKQSEGYIISHLAIEEGHPTPDSSENAKRDAENEERDGMRGDSTPLEELEQLKRDNKALRNNKQTKLLKHKLLCSSNPTGIS
jgi:hypothetical protein